MFQISVYSSKHKIDDFYEFNDFNNFLMFHLKTQSLSQDENFQVDYIIDSELINFEEYYQFIDILFNGEFYNPDNCKTVDDLDRWLKFYRFLAIIDDHFN